MADYFSRPIDIANSLELLFLIDRHLAARRSGHIELASTFAHAAQGVLTAAMPAHASEIASVASRKGDGRLIGSALAQHLSPTSAAAVNVIWLLRGARRPAIDSLAGPFRYDPVFNDAIRKLCARALLSANVTLPCPPITTTPFEVGSPRPR